MKIEAQAARPAWSFRVSCAMSEAVLIGEIDKGKDKWRRAAAGRAQLLA